MDEDGNSCEEEEENMENETELLEPNEGDRLFCVLQRVLIASKGKSNLNDVMSSRQGVRPWGKCAT